MPRKAVCKVRVSPVGLGDHQKAAGTPVDAMHDSGTPGMANARKPAIPVCEQRVYKGSPGNPRRGVNDHAGRFVDDKQFRILVHDLQRNGFGRKRRWRHGGEGNLELLALAGNL